MGRQPGGSCIDLHVMPGLVGGLDSGWTQRSWEGRERGHPCWGAQGLGRALIVKAAEEVQALHKYCIPGASSPGVVRELSFTVLSFGLRGTVPEMGRLGGCLLGLPQAFLI